MHTFKKIFRAILNPRMALIYVLKKLIELLDLEPVHRIWIFGGSRRILLSNLLAPKNVKDVVVLNPFLRTEGTSVTLEELVTICGILKLSGACRVLEIGTFDGNTTLNMAANLPDDGRVVTVDLPLDSDGDLHLDISSSNRNITARSKVGEQFASSIYKERIRQIFADTGSLDWNTLAPPFDLIFIDGCHDYAYVRSDTNNAISCLSETGLIVWHDYAMKEEVSRAVDEFSNILEIQVLAGTRLAIGYPRERMPCFLV